MRVQRKIRLIDSCRREIATAEVVESGERFSGRADLSAMPLAFRRGFEEFEEIVKGQMFSFLDLMEEQIQELNSKVVFEDQSEVPLDDLQIYPSTGRLSFPVAAGLHEQANLLGSLED